MLQHKLERVEEALAQAHRDAEKPTDWRQIRARVGGLERALREVQAQRDHAQHDAAALRRGRRLEANASLVGLLRDMAHAADCVDVNCARCLRIARDVEAARAEYLPEAELIAQLDHAHAVTAAGARVLEAIRSQGVGAAAQRAEALRKLAQVCAAPELGPAR